MNEAQALREPERKPLVASLRHTITLIAILLAIAAYGIYSQRSADGASVAARRGSALPLYMTLLAAEWGLFRYATIGLRKSGTPFRDLLGARWTGWKDVARDVAIALGVWAVWTVGSTLVDTLWGGATSKAINNLLPRDPAEIAAWIALSVTAGFCEEAIYRGYLQRQFEALTGSPFLAVLGQAVIFGISHGYQGVRNVLLITLYGALFGALAHWRRSLKPGMILHAWTDVFGGIFQKSF
jgi:uncharacterized protein